MTVQDRLIAWIENLPQIYSHEPSRDVDTPVSASASASPSREREGNNSGQPLELSPLSSLSRLGMDYESPQPPTTKASSRVSSSASGRTRSTSALKRQFLELRLDEEGLETKALNANALEALPNPEAASLLRTMRRVGNCKGILPQDMRGQVLQSHSIKEDDLDDWDSAFKDSSAFAHLPGRIPSAREIELVCNWTTDCIDSKHEEADWNDEVHFRLLRAILREPGEKMGAFFNIATSYTARPHKDWLPKSIGSKMGNFCSYADSTQQNTATAKSYEDFCRTTPTRSVNHTDFQRLQTHRIVLSIETKAGSNSDAAELQLGVWHAAQWAFLKSSLSRAQDDACSTEEQTKRVDEALSRLRFIPAVIVQGHRWLFVLSTRQGQKTILWKEYQFGSTSTVVETYQIVAGLRQLAAWADQVYLPWFHREILHIV